MSRKPFLIAMVLLALGAFAFGQAAKLVDPQVAELIASMEKSDVAGREACDKLVAIGKPATAQLIAAFKSPVARVRYWSLSAAARIGEEAVYAPMVELLKSDPNAVVRETALWHLQYYPRPEAWDLAAKALDDPSRDMRHFAIKLLSDKNRVEALPKLEETAFKNPDDQTRREATVAVATLKDAAAVEFLRKVLRADANEGVRETALRCVTLLKKKQAEALSVLIDGLEDRNENVRVAAATLLLKGTTVDFHYNPTADSELRAAGVKAWREWFEKNRARLAWDETRKRFEVASK